VKTKGAGNRPETREQIRVTLGETYKTANSGGEVKLQSPER